MARYDETPQTEDMLQALSGLNYLVNGVEGNTAALSVLPAATLKASIQTLGLGVNANARPQASVSREGDLFTYNETNTDGVPARDKLKDLIGKRAGGSINNIEANALKSAMYAAGYEVDLAASAFSTNELGELAFFNSEYLDTPGATLGGLLERNTGLSNASAEMQTVIDQAVVEADAREASAIAEAAALDQSLNSRLDSTLVYAGYMTPENMGDDVSRVHAVKEMMFDNKEHLAEAGHTNITDALRSYFEQDAEGNYTAQIKEDGFASILEMTEGNMVPARLQSDLESGNTQLIATAQNYLITQGYDTITADGIVRTDTTDAAQELLSREQTVPEGIYKADGTMDYEHTTDMARAGQLLLPDDSDLSQYIGADNAAAALSLPLEADRGAGDILTREEFIAIQMVDGGTYNGFIADHNAENLDVQLDVVAELSQIEINSPEGPMVIEASLGPVLATPDHTPTDESVAARNYVDVKVVDTEIIGGSSVLAELVQNDAIGYTNEGTLAFDRENRDLVTEVYAEAFTEYAAVNGGEMSMHDALRLSHGITTIERDQFLGGATGMTQAPTQYEAQRLAQEMGFEMDKSFNPAISSDMQALLQGTYAWENKESLASMGSGNYVQNFMAGNDAAPAALEMQASISRVSGMPHAGVTDVLLAQDALAPAIEQQAPQETVTAEAPEVSAPTTLPMPQPGVNISYAGFPISQMMQSEIQIPSQMDEAPQSFCTSAFNGCAIGAPMSVPQIDLGIPTLGNNTNNMSSPNIRVFDPMSGQ